MYALGLTRTCKEGLELARVAHPSEDARMGIGSCRITVKRTCSRRYL
jgi:hypothetical protein